MGKVEKLVVLSVLFLVALILVVSVTMDDPQVVSAGGASAEERQIAMVPNDAPSGAAAGAAMVAPPIDSTPPAASTLSAAVETAATKSPAQLAPAGSILVTLEGLEDSVLPDFKLYTWREGDSFRLLANTYYGDWKKLTLLRQANAGNEDVKAGDRIYVPVYDNPNLPQPEGAGTLADEPAAKPANAKAPVAEKAAVAAKSEPKAAAAKASAAGRVHVVKSGESLWIIAKKELGDGSRWKEIQELNGLKKPEAIKVGMKLKLP
ncbi:MAG: LysM peptidoglycan-binding domain-containing protein [Planctomycetia bacterium]|jgi:nucleoid-associated protein YgaU